MRRYPAITLFVEITAKEHSAIAPFCEAHRITVGEFVTCRGVGFSMKDFTGDERNRLALLEEIADRFGGKWPPVPDGAERKLTPGLNVEALAMLEAMRIHDGYESIEAWIRKSLADSVLCLNEFITNTEPGTNRVRKAFGVLAQGSGRKPRRWRAAPSARMLRWRRPPSRRSASAKASKRHTLRPRPWHAPGAGLLRWTVSSPPRWRSTHRFKQKSLALMSQICETKTMMHSLNRSAGYLNRWRGARETGQAFRQEIKPEKGICTMTTTTQTKLTPRLHARLSTYTALTGAALAASAATLPSAEGSIVYSGPVNLAVPQTADGLYLNFVTGATGTTPATAPAGFDFDPYAAGGTTLAFFWGITASPDNAGVANGAGTAGKYLALAAGVTVGPTSIFNTSAQTANASQFRAAAGTAYLGVRFDNEATGQINYGYVHVRGMETDTSGFPFTILDYGYDNTGAAIVTGAVPEPSTAAALGFGVLTLGAAGVRRWRRQRRMV